MLFVAVLGTVWGYHGWVGSRLLHNKPALYAGIKTSFGTSGGGGEMRIKIQGTQNAYTTLRSLDVVLYGLSEPQGESGDMKIRALGVYRGDSREVVPLCNHVLGCTEFYQDFEQAPLSAEALKKDGLLLRVMSSDRRGTDCFIVEEYLDDDIFIPLRSPDGAAAAADATVKVVPTLASSPTQMSTTVPTLMPAPLVPSQKSPSSLSMTMVELQEATCAAQEQVLNLQKAILEKMKSALHQSQPQPLTTGLTRVNTSKAPAPVGPYSQAVVANGFVFLSGSLGLDPVTGKLVDGGIIFQANQALDNIASVLSASGTSFENVVKVTILLKEIKDSPVVNNLYKERFSDGEFPARTTFAVADLPLKALVEIEVTALLQ